MWDYQRLHPIKDARQWLVHTHASQEVPGEYPQLLCMRQLSSSEDWGMSFPLLQTQQLGKRCRAPRDTERVHQNMWVLLSS